MDARTYCETHGVNLIGKDRCMLCERGISVEEASDRLAARCTRLEALLEKWLSYCSQAGAEHELDERNPVHVLILETRAAIKSN